MKSPILFLLLTAAGTALAPACQTKKPCSDGFEFDGSLCAPVYVAPSGGSENGGNGGAGGESMGGASSGGSESSGPSFGRSCTVDDDCDGGTICDTFQSNSCVGLCGPGDAFENDCPEGYTCTDFVVAVVCEPPTE